MHHVKVDDEEANRNNIYVDAQSHEKVVVEGVSHLAWAEKARDIAIEIGRYINETDEAKKMDPEQIVSVANDAWDMYEAQLMAEEKDFIFSFTERRNRCEELLRECTRSDFIVKVGDARLARKEVTAFSHFSTASNTIIFAHMKNAPAIPIKTLNSIDAWQVEKLLDTYQSIVNAQTIPSQRNVKFRSMDALPPEHGAAERRKYEIMMHGLSLTEEQRELLKSQVDAERASNTENTLAEKIAQKMHAKTQNKESNDNDDPDLDKDDKLPESLELFEQPDVKPPKDFKFIKMKPKSDKK